MSEREKYILGSITKSKTKRELIKKAGGFVINDETLTKATDQGEEQGYRRLLKDLELPLPDAMLIPFYIDDIPTVQRAAIFKAEAGLNYYYEEAVRNGYLSLHFNDALWAVGDRNSGKLSWAVNKAGDPNKNGEDAHRLAEFFTKHTGENFFSASTNIFVNLQTGEMDIRNRALGVGKIRDLSSEELWDIFYNRLRESAHHGAFDLNFIQESGFIEFPLLLPYYYQGFPGESKAVMDVVSSTPYELLHAAAHGIIL